MIKKYTYISMIIVKPTKLTDSHVALSRLKNYVKSYKNTYVTNLKCT